MPRAARPWLRRVTRLALVALLAFGVVAAPALSFAAEAHESVAHADDHADADDATHEHADAGTGCNEDTLHLVMHLATCCGHACALLPTAWPTQAHAHAAPPAVHADACAVERAPEHLLRPPISA